MDFNLGQSYLTPQLLMNQIAQSRAATQQEQANTAYRNVQTQQGQMRLEQMKHMQSLMQGSPSLMQGSPSPQYANDSIALMQRMGNLSMRTGDFKTGSEMLYKAAQLANAQARIASSQISAQARKATAGMKTAQAMFSEVNSQYTLDMANAKWLEATGTPSPLAGQNYSPGLIQKWDARIAHAKGQLSAEERAQQEAITNQHRWNQDSIAEQKLNLYRQRTDVINLLRDYRKGNALNNAKNPVMALPKSLLTNAASIVKNKFPGLASNPEAVGMAANEVASYAQQEMKQNPGISLQTATMKGLARAIKQGDLTHVDGLFGGSDEYTPSGEGDSAPVTTPKEASKGTKTAPIPLEVGEKPTQAGAWYKLPDGRVAQWSGK